MLHLDLARLFSFVLRSLRTFAVRAFMMTAVILVLPTCVRAQGTSVPDASVPVVIAPSISTTQFFVLNADGSVSGANSAQSSSYSFHCSTASGLLAPTAATPFVLDNTSRILFETGAVSPGTLNTAAVFAPFSGSNCGTTVSAPVAGNTPLLSAIDSFHNRALFLTTMGSSGPDLLTSYNTSAVGNTTLVGNLVKEAQTTLGSGGQYTAIVADTHGRGLVAVTELRTATSPGGLWIYQPGFGKAFKVFGPTGNDLPAVNAFIIPNPKNDNGSLLVLANQDNLTSSNLTAPPPVTTVFTIIDLGQLQDLIGTSASASTLSLPFVDTISTRTPAYAIFGAGYNSVNGRLYALLGGGTSQTNTFISVVRFNPYSPAAPGELKVADFSTVPLQALSLPTITVNAASATLQALTTNPNTVYTVDISGTNASATATSVTNSTFSDPGFNPTYIATNPLAGETYIASSSGYVDVLTLPAGSKPAGSIEIIAPLSISTTGSTSSIQLLSFFPVPDSSLSSTNITVLATAASTGQSFTFATIGAGSTADLPAYVTGTFPTADTYSLLALFPGDSIYPAMVSLKVMVAVAISPYVTTIKASATGSAGSGTAAVTLNGSAYAPTGTLTIKDAQTLSTLATYFLSGGGIANPLYVPFTYSSNVSGIVAVYSGDSKNSTSTSPSASITNTQAATTLTLTLPTTATNGTAFSGSISLNPAGTPPASTPTGYIYIYGIQSGSASRTRLGLINASSVGVYQNTAQVSLTVPAAGRWSIFATYPGDATFAASTSTPTSVVVSSGPAVITVTPSSLVFQTAVNSSTFQDISVQNTGQAILNISGIATTGSGFSSTTSCGPTLAAGASCGVRTTFAPTTSGGSTGQVTINSDASNSTSLIVYLGGATPTTGVTLSPQTLTFSTPPGTSSALQSITLTNTGNTALSITNIGVTNPVFSQFNGCPNSLAAGAQCVIRVDFSAPARGTYAGQVTVADNALGSPHVVNLTGTGSAPVTLTASTTTFIDQTVGTASNARPVVTLSNNTSSPITVPLINLDDSTNFERNSTSCGPTLGANSSCSFPVEFHPTTPGIKTLNVLVTTSASTALTVTFTGLGLAAGQCADADGDSLCDDWEQNGVWVRIGSGEQFVDLPALGAKWHHKDIFLHIDWMATALGVTGAHSHQPIAAAMKTVVTSFANAPLPNPDGVSGINLHIDCGPTCYTGTNGISGTQSKAVQLAELSALDPTPYDPNTGAFSWSTFDQNSGTFASSGRSMAFHHVIFAHDQHAGFTSSGISRNSPIVQPINLFALGASDLIVTLGSWSSSTGTANEQAGTLMHELGHNLALQHGGQDGNNFKPNYISIMNYHFQTTGVIVNGAQGLFDYSENALPRFDEGLLNEVTGLNYSGITYPAIGPLPVIDQVGTQWYCPGDDSTKVSAHSVPFMNGNLNWDCDAASVLDSQVRADVNADNQVTYYDSFVDWTALNFAGGSIGSFGAGRAPVNVSPSDTFSQDQESLTVPLTRVTITTPGTLQTAPGTTTTLRFVVTNTGSLPDAYNLTASSNAGWANATVTPAMLTLSSGASAQVTVSYTVPTGSATGAGDRITLNAQSSKYTVVNDSAQVFVYATMTPAPLTVSVDTVNFGILSTGAASNVRSLVITNTGASGLTIPSIAASTEFAQSNTCSGTLAAGASCTVSMTFMPTAVGSRTGSLSILSSASSTAISVSLLGTAVLPQLLRPTVTLVVTPSTTSTGKTITLTASVVAPSGSTKPTGTVTIVNGSTIVGQATLDASGNAVITSATLLAGTYNLLTTYSGDSVFLAANAAYQPLTIVNAATSSTVLTASATIIAPGGSVTLTGTVPTSSGTVVPTGSVRFMDGTTLLGTSTLNSSGVATYSATGLANGTHSLTAFYTGDAVYAASASGAVTVTVTTVATAVTLTSSAAVIVVGTPITFTGTATATGTTPTGTISFVDGTAILGTGALNSSGVATFTTTALAVGSHSVTAQYAANGIFLGSISTAKLITVTGTPDFSVSASPSSLTLKSGGTGTVTLTMTPTNGYAGTAQFSCGNLPAYATCTFAPASLTFASATQTAQTSVLTINTTQHSSLVLPAMPYGNGRGGVSLAVLLSPGLFLLLAVSRKRRFAARIGRLLTIILLLSAAASAMLLVGCGATPPTNTQVGTYTLNISVTDGTTAHVLNYPVTVN